MRWVSDPDLYWAVWALWVVKSPSECEKCQNWYFYFFILLFFFCYSFSLIHFFSQWAASGRSRNLMANWGHCGDIWEAKSSSVGHFWIILNKLGFFIEAISSVGCLLQSFLYLLKLIAYGRLRCPLRVLLSFFGLPSSFWGCQINPQKAFLAAFSVGLTSFVGCYLWQFLNEHANEVAINKGWNRWKP